MAVWITAGLLIGVALGGAFLYYATVTPGSQVFGPALLRGPASSKGVALTFDDGPSVPFTSQILDLLREHNVKATFFVCGRNVERYPEIARRIVAEGHAIGNHTYSHPFLYLLGRRAIAEEIDRAQAAIEKATGVVPTLFRPPYGIRWFGLYPLLSARGLRMVQWSATGYDWKNGREAIIAATLRSLVPGAIILLHDGHGVRPPRLTDRSSTVAALPAILEGVKSSGWEFVLPGDTRHPT